WDVRPLRHWPRRCAQYRTWPLAVDWKQSYSSSAWEPERLDVFVLGTNMGLFHKWFQGGWGPSITDYEFMGGICTSQPEAVSWEPGRLDVFVTGTDRALYHKWFDGGWGPSLTDFEYMGGICRRASSVGGRAVSMCSSLARTAHCITSGLMATGG